MAQNYIEVISSYKHKVAAIVSLSNNRNAKRLAKKYNAKLFFDYKSAIINNKIVDAWIICCSWEEIANCLKFFIKTKQPLLVEKSITLNSQKLQELFKNNKKIFPKFYLLIIEIIMTLYLNY